MNWLIFSLFSVLFRNRNPKCPSDNLLLNEEKVLVHLEACFRRHILSCLMQKPRTVLFKMHLTRGKCNVSKIRKVNF